MVFLPVADPCPRRGTRRERVVALHKLYRHSAPARQRSRQRKARFDVKLLLRFQHPHAELRFEKTVHRSSIGMEPALGEPLEERGSQHDFVEHDRVAAVFK